MTGEKFISDIETRLREIAVLIPGAKTLERRALQKERTDLETKLQKVRAT